MSRAIWSLGLTGQDKPTAAYFDPSSFTALFPTHRHEPAFWEALGRCVATFGFLEETLAKAIFAFAGMKEYPEHEAQARFEAWLPQLKRALSDTLGSLIPKYETAVRDHGGADTEGLNVIVSEMWKAATIRNVLCHGSWRKPDSGGRSLPVFVNRSDMLFDTPVDVAFLTQTQRATADLAVAVINSVTQMGWRFPGASGPGIALV